ncbi:hypothetical protein ACVH9Z_25500 [Rhodococcus opacus]
MQELRELWQSSCGELKPTFDITNGHDTTWFVATSSSMATEDRHPRPTRADLFVEHRLVGGPARTPDAVPSIDGAFATRPFQLRRPSLN